MEALVRAPTAEEARVFTDRIKIAVEGTWLLIQEAYTSRVWAALGYKSWDAYCTAEFGETRLRLPREERQEVVASLRDSGLSVRAIASATGAAYNTVLSDVTQIESPAEITGTDGKTYAAARPEPEPNIWVQPAEPDFERMVTPTSKPKRRPLPEAFTDAGSDLTRAAERLARLTEDDRFPKNLAVTRQRTPELLAALDHLAHLTAALRLDEADTTEEARRWWATSLNKISDTLRGIAHSLSQEQ